MLTTRETILAARLMRVQPLSALVLRDEVLRWSSFFDQFAALLRWIRVSCQAANLIGSVLFA
jgi:hypothetical protein